MATSELSDILRKRAFVFIFPPLPPRRLCIDLQSLITERAEIEKAYAKSLRSWSKRWGEIIEKGPEYGTIEAAWKGVLTEADRLSEEHLKVKDELNGDVSNLIKTWQKDNYHKTMMHIKERKEMEDLFKKAQKPWAKHLTKVEKTKAEYHNACKMEKSASNLERNATGDSSLSPDQVNVMPVRLVKDSTLMHAQLEINRSKLAI